MGISLRMYPILVCITLLISVGTAEPENWPAVLNSRLVSVFATPAAAGDECKKPNGGFVGCNDNKDKIQLCIANVVIEFSCKELTGSDLYCNPNSQKCDALSADPSPDYKCPTPDGYFPDPLNCKKFFVCNNKISANYECLGTNNYDVNGQSCKANVPCYSFSADTGLCRNKIGEFVVHPRNATFYVLCFVKPILLACEHENYVFNSESKTCAFRCPGQGIFKDAANKQFYYLCVLSGGVYRPQRGDCGEGREFDEDLKACGTSVTTTTEPTTTTLDPIQ